ncbi:putative WEB family protein At1g65010, chloroplastic isoform X2 [Solanum lycopersicum]|uniref:putative WEB family protein At1g65010, chloroplastic isoform X2 n=1 Tax=Solanum lycopersicum TaxID=4081 RepID=UPI000276C32A|nr:rab11 family-interacting protein 3 isoform X2 [Solanum lycopersicum]
MGFKKVYKALQEIFPEVDSRILRAVAIEHCKDGDTAVEVVLNEVIPCLTKLPSTSAEHSGVTGISSAAAVDANGPPQPDAFLLHNTKDSDELQNGSSFYDAGCGHHQTIEDTDGESLQNYHDAVGGNHVPLEVDGGGTPVSVEKCDKSKEKVTAYEPCLVMNAMSNAEDPEATSFTANKKNGAEVADNKLCLPTECVVLHDTFEGTENSSSDDSTALVHKRIHEEVSSQDNRGMKDPEGQVVPLSAQTLCGSEDSIEFVVAPDVHNFELEKTEISLHQKEKTELSDSVDATSSEDLAGVILVTKEESMPNSVVTASGQICSIDLLEDMMTEAKSNKKTLFLAVESIICLMRDVELQEEAAEQAKLEAAKGGLDMLERVEDLKEMLQHAKEANDMHAGEVYGEKSILATEVKELQSRLLGLADERDKSLAVLDEMRQTLEVRMAAAVKEIKAAEQERLEKKEVARKALADQEIIMEKVVQEANVLKQEAEENAKLRDFLVDRGRVVDTLQGEISVICQDVRLLKEKFDDRVPLCKSLCSGQTSCILASSSSSLKSMISDEVAEPADLLHAPEKVDRVSCHEEEHKVCEDVKSVIHNTDLVDDGWEIFDNRELYV